MGLLAVWLHALADFPMQKPALAMKWERNL
jgi:hypothetical protein